MSDGARIVSFYEGRAPDDRGRSLEDVLDFNDHQLEHVHDFIQWLFPLCERSGANPGAPLLDGGAIAAFRTRPDLRAALRRSLDRMLAFYGFAWSGDRIERSPAFDARRQWLTPGNHNHLRLTRMLISLHTLGLKNEAQALYRCLRETAEASGGVSPVTLQYWNAAAAEV